MATSKCLGCDGTSFEMKETGRIKGTEFKYTFVQCSDCGGVVGVLDYFNIGEIINKLALKLNVDLSK